MGHQQDSVDISHLQAIALGNHDAVAIGGSKSLRVRGLHMTTPSLHTLHATTATNSLTRGSSHNTEDTQLWRATQREHPKDTKPAAPQAELPNTPILNSPMHSNSTPSHGDTQEAPSWVYREKEDSSTKSAPILINEDDTGQINITDGLEQDLPTEEELTLHHNENPDQNDDDDDDNDDGNDEDVELVSQEVLAEYIRAEPFPESRRFQQPTTPHITGTKRKRPVEEEIPHVPTPKLPINPFAGLGTSDMMRSSQIFHATQAQTSPLLVHSDTLSERPSPNVNNFGRPSTAGSLSSPVTRKDPRSTMARAVTEPQGNYISMKESQEARERRRKKLWTVEVDPLDHEFDQQFHTQPTYGIGHEGSTIGKIRDPYFRRKLPSTSTQHLDTKERPSSLSNRADRKSTHQQRHEIVLISDATPPPEISGNITEDETEREEQKEEGIVDDDIDELADDNKENVEVPRTGSRHYGQMIISQSSPSNYRIGNSRKRSVHQPATQVVGSPSQMTFLSREPTYENSTQPYAVRDSQPSQQLDSRKLPAPFRSDSSSESRKVIPQSQISQKSRSSVPQSSIPSRAETSNEIVDLVLSSPLQATEPQRKTSKGSTATMDDSGDVREKYLVNGRPSKDISHDASGPSVRAEQDLLSKDMQSDQSTKSHVSASSKSTVPETSSAAFRDAPLPHIIPNSSQDMSSPGPLACTAPRPATNQSLKGRSLESTVLETAQDHLSPSASNNQPQGCQSIPRGGTLASPSKRFQRRTLTEITAAPSPPDAVQVFELSDLGILTKDDEKFYRTVGRQNQTDTIHERQEDELSNNTFRGRVQLGADRGRRRPTTSTKWKPSTSDPPLEPPESPTPPASSAISRPTQVQPSSEAGLSTSSPLSSPPPSDREGRLTSVASSTVPVVLTHRDDHPVQEVQASPSPDEELRTVSNSSSGLPVLAPDRVFAHFNGKSSFFYTATCLGVIPGDEPRYSVRFDDGAEACISAFGIKRLEFRPGDVVKVDLQDCRNKNYVVVGTAEPQKFEDSNTIARLRKNDPDDARGWPGTDIYGHSKVLLLPKGVHSAMGEQDEGEQITVRMYDLYITQSMWTNIKNREYIHTGRKLSASESSQMPVDRPSTSSSPSSRLKRLKATATIQSTHISGTKQNLFGNMVFTLTNIPQLTELEKTKSLILTHGGKVLDDGFDALFHVPVLHRITSPKKSDSDRDFHLIREARDLGFTCLITNKHCRRAKYIQALALGIPCLASRWISDCVTKQRLLPWSAYLLPAGESAFLGGATHSRVLPAWPAEITILSKLLDQRPRILQGSSILLIMAKNEEDSMRQYPLLTYALGPARVARALSIEAAARAVAEAHAIGEPWDWVFSYDREREVERILFGSTAKKRKVRNGGQEVRTRVIGNEFVIQSLISGQLLEE